MNVSNSETSRLFRELDELRSGPRPVKPGVLAERLASLGLSVPINELTETVSGVSRFLGPQAGHLMTPPLIGRIVLGLLQGRTANAICDPCAGLGALLAVVQQATSAKRSIAFGADADENRLGSVLFPSAEWHTGDPLELLGQLSSPVDVVACIVPFGAKASQSLTLTSKAGEPVELRDELGHLILPAATSHLAEDGLGLFVVPLSLFLSRRSVLTAFGSLGFGIDAVLAIPPGTFAPYASIPTYLVVVKRTPIERAFVAPLSHDEKANSQILANYLSGEDTGEVDFGCRVALNQFRGIESLRASQHLAKASERIGFPAVTLGELATAINLGRQGNGFAFPEAENAIFVPMIGQTDVVASAEDLKLKAQNYAQVVIDPARSQARFVSQYLNSELGKVARESSQAGAVIRKLNKQGLQELQVFIPDLQTQRTMLEIEDRLTAQENVLSGLRNELSELRRDLWRSPSSTDSVTERLTPLSERISGALKGQADVGLDHWLETIPFPMASILRAWRATPSDDFKSMHEHLLHFFEATAEFLGVILLSAFGANDGLYEPHKRKLVETMMKQGHSFERATFGAWRLVVEYFGKQTRLLLRDGEGTQKDARNDQAMCATVFADESLLLPRVLSDKRIASVLLAANKMRNDWSGHGGVVGQKEAKARNEQLVAELERLRDAMADVWDRATVVNALHCRPRSGRFENEVALLRGSNSEFLKESRTMSAWLDVDRLYIVNGSQPTALKLLPLVRVGPSPEHANNACYFFNRTERDGARFVSYHFADKPELSGQFQDAVDAIRRLTEL